MARTMAFSADAHLEAIGSKVGGQDIDPGIPWKNMAEKYHYDKAYRDQAVAMLGQKLDTTFYCKAKSRSVRDGAENMRAACMLSLTQTYKFSVRLKSKGAFENGEDNYVLLVIGHPSSVFAIR